MGLEIERKYLVDKQLFKPSLTGQHVHQLYLKREKGRSVRIRIIGDHAFITIKTTISALVRNEFEYEIPLQDAHKMFELFHAMPAIKKIRYQEIIEGSEWVVDEFEGENEGLLMAEIELANTTAGFAKPKWLLGEVTNDPRFHNSNLSVSPYKKWTEKP